MKRIFITFIIILIIILAGKKRKKKISSSAKRIKLAMNCEMKIILLFKSFLLIEASPISIQGHRKRKGS